MPIKLVKDIVKSLVDKEDEIKIEEKRGNKTVVIDIIVDPTDIGKIIGKKGAIIDAIRLIARNVGLKTGHRVVLNLIE
jgi:uncharacterized protein